MFESEQNELWRAWTIQLGREHEQLTYLYGLHEVLRVPFIQIADLTGCWATWDPKLRTITMSARLIREYSWDIVIEVFKHEMAHQMVSDLFGNRDLHGTGFHNACQRLAVAPWAAAASGVLPTEIPRVDGRATTDEEERLLRRAEKLLALGTSSNEHEALLAMQRVRELFAKYNLERLRNTRKTQLVTKILTQRKLRLTAAEMRICSILNSHFFVRALLSWTYDAESNTNFRAIELLGTNENVVMAEYVHAFLVREVRELWRQYSAKNLCARRLERSYILGLLTGFQNKLKTDALSEGGPNVEETRTLMVLSNNELEEFTRWKCPRLRTARRTGGVDRDTFHAGTADGASITINRPIHENRESRSRLLVGQGG